VAVPCLRPAPGDDPGLAALLVGAGEIIPKEVEDQ
jgi:hypothetical protein